MMIRFFMRRAVGLMLAAALLLGLFGPAPLTVRAAGVTYYVATNGSDANNGTSLATPFRTIQRCADVAQPGDTCAIRAGTYRETVNTPRSGTAGNPITFMPYNNETVTISGADVITGWTAHDLSGGKAIYKANMPWNYNVRVSGAYHQTSNNQVFIDGLMMPEARWPNLFFPLLTRQRNSDQARSDSATNLQPHSATYIDSDLAPFSVNFWAGGKINFAPGYKIEWTTCDVTGNTSNSVSFVCNPDPGSNNERTQLDTPGSGEFYLPGAQNPYYLWGKYEALDSPGEWFYSANTLYLWTPDSVNPNTKFVEARRRAWAFDLSGDSHITIRGLRLFAAGINTSTSSSHLLIEGIEGYYMWHFQEIPPLYRVLGTRGLPLFGSNNIVRDSLIAYSAGAGIELYAGYSGPTSNNQVINNVIYDVGYMGHDAGIGGASPGGASSHLVRNNTLFNSGNIMIRASPGLNIRHNDVYQSHLQISDLGTIYTWNTDGLNAEISHNWVHDGYGEWSLALKFYGTHGIYLDDNSRNYTVFRNVTWNTTAPGIFAYGRVDPGTNRIYNNTVDGRMSFDAKAGQTLNGFIVRNNIATDLDVSAPNLTQSNNWGGDGLYLNRAGRDYRLRDDSPAVNAGATLPPYTDGFVGSAPDIGAYENGGPPFIAGALVRAQDLASLAVSCAQDPAGTTATCNVSNLPLGRKLPLDFEIRIGSAAAATGCWTTMNYTTHLGSAVCRNVPTGGLSGPQPIAIRLAGGSWVNAGSIDLGGLAVFSVTPNSGPVTGGTALTISGRRFQAAPTQALYSRPVTLNNTTGRILYDHQVVVALNTASLIAAGKMRPDCGDLRFADAYETLNYWIEEGCNTANTRVWVRAKAIPTGSSTIRLSYGNPNLTSASSGADTFFFFDDFEDGALNPLIVPAGGPGITISETGGQMRIAGSTNSGNQYGTWGFQFQLWQVTYPANFAIDSELSVISGPSSFKATPGSFELNLFGGLPKSIGYFSGSWQQLGTSAVSSATFNRQKFSMGFTGPSNNMTLRWFEGGDLANARATRSGLNNPTRGFFHYGPDAIASFDARYDNIRIRAYAFPDPTSSVGAETVASSRFNIGPNLCRNIVVLNSAQATCLTPPAGMGAVPVTVINPDNSTASFNSFTYLSARPDTVGIFRPSNATFFLRNSNTTGPADISAVMGSSADQPVVGDWNGDDIDTIGIYRTTTGTFLLKDANSTGAPVVYQFTLGNPNDLPMAGDWDGDGRDGVGVFRPTNGLLYLKNALATGFADFTMVLGIAGDRPLAGDWDGNGIDSPGVYRPSNSHFFLTNQVCNCIVMADYTLRLGDPGDVGFVGDWDGDGRSGVGVFRPTNGVTFLRNALTTGFADISMVYGIAGDRPVAGKWTGSSPPGQAPLFAPGR